MSSEQTYTTSEVAETVGVTPRTLYRWLSEGRLPKPQVVTVGRLKVRAWTDADIERARQLKNRLNFDELYGRARDWDARKLPNYERMKATGLGATMCAPAPDFLTPEQLAERLQLPVSWVYEQTRTRAKRRAKKKKDTPLPRASTGKYLRFFWPDVVDWLKRCSVAEKES